MCVWLIPIPRSTAVVDERGGRASGTPARASTPARPLPTCVHRHSPTFLVCPRRPCCTPLDDCTCPLPLPRLALGCRLPGPSPGPHPLPVAEPFLIADFRGRCGRHPAEAEEALRSLGGRAPLPWDAVRLTPCPSAMSFQKSRVRWRARRRWPMCRCCLPSSPRTTDCGVYACRRRRRPPPRDPLLCFVSFGRGIMHRRRRRNALLPQGIDHPSARGLGACLLPALSRCRPPCPRSCSLTP